MKPIVYLICGLGGSGKSTYSQKLAENGMMKISIDEYVYSLHGRSITKMPEHEYLEIYQKARIELDNQLAEAIKQKHNIVIDFGFWTRKGRDYYKRLIEENGGEWKLIYLKASPEVLLRRLKERNKLTHANAFPVSEEKLQEYIARFEEPNDEGEEIILQS